jgi:hypothetical protein
MGVWTVGVRPSAGRKDLGSLCVACVVATEVFRDDEAKEQAADACHCTPWKLDLCPRFCGHVSFVQFVEEADHFFLKTVIPSRKATRDYLNQRNLDAED